MSLDPRQSVKKQRPIPPIGSFAARCFMIVDMGTQKKSFQGKESAIPVVKFGWEFPNLPFAVFNEGEQPKPLAVFQDYTVSLGDRAKLPKMLCSWRGVPAIQNLGAELPQYLGAPCLLGIIHNPDKQIPEIKYANISSIMRLPQEMSINPMVNKSIFFNLDQYSHQAFLSLPEWIQNEIKKTPEWNGILSQFGPPPQAQQTNSAPVQNTQQQNWNNPTQQTAQNMAPPVQQGFNNPPQQYQQPQYQAPAPQQNMNAPAFNQQQAPPVQQNNSFQMNPAQANDIQNAFDNNTPPPF